MLLSRGHVTVRSAGFERTERFHRDPDGARVELSFQMQAL